MDTLIPDIRITAAARFGTDAAVSGKILKQTLQQRTGTDPRRLSRLSICAALGAGLLARSRRISPDCAVWLGTPFSSPAVFAKMAGNVLDHHAAMPFDFIANLHNAPAFHAAEALGCHGATSTVPAGRDSDTRFHPLLLAAASLPIGGQAAVGWCYEHQPPYPHTGEGSVWLLLEHGADTGSPLCFSKKTTPQAATERSSETYYWQHIADLAATLHERSHTIEAGSWTIQTGCPADVATAYERIG